MVITFPLDSFGGEVVPAADSSEQEKDRYVQTGQGSRTKRLANAVAPSLIVSTFNKLKNGHVPPCRVYQPEFVYAVRLVNHFLFDAVAMLGGRG